MLKHTPGPWVLNVEALGHLLEGCVHIDAADNSHFALATVVYEMEDDRGHADDFGGSALCRGNAKLIAAAPEMLALLRRFNESTNDIDPEDYERIIVDLDELLARLDA